MTVSSLFRPQPQLIQPEEVPTFVVKGAFKTSTSATSKPRRRVQFKETVSVRPIVHVNNMCDDEIADVWYNKTECQDMKRSMALTVKMISAGLFQGDDDEHCARGLEYRTRAGATRRRENKVNALDAVLDEQDRQRGRGMEPDDEAIRQCFLDENLHCRLAALEKGIADQEEARSLDAEDDDDDYSDADGMDYCTTLNIGASLRAPQSRFTSAAASDRMVE